MKKYLTYILFLILTFTISAQTIVNPNRAEVLNPPTGGGGGSEAGAYDIETGDLTQFDDENLEGSSTITASDTSEIHGDYGALVIFDGANGSNEVWEGIDIAGSPDTVRARAYFIIDPNFAFNDANDEQHIFAIQDGFARLVSFGLRGHSQVAANYYQIEVSVGTDDNQFESVSNYPLGNTLLVEIMATISATTGSWYIWFDGVLVASETGLNNSALVIDRIWIGGAYAGGSSQEPTAGSWIKFDDVIYNTDGSEIGAYSP